MQALNSTTGRSSDEDEAEAASARRRSSGLSKLLPFRSSVLGFFAGFERQVARSKAHADLLQETIGRSAPGKDPDEVVRNLLFAAVGLEDDRFRLELDRTRIEQHLQFPGAYEVFHTLRVALLDAAEPLAAIGDGHLVTGLTSQAHGGFHRAVAAADDQDLLIDVMVRLDQAVHHLGQLFPFNTELARFTRLAQGQDYSTRAILIRRGRDRENAVFAALNVFHLLAGGHVEVGPVENHVPEGKQVLFRKFQLLEPAIHRKFRATPPVSTARCSPVDTMKSARLRIMFQKASRFSFESCSFLNLPYIGNSTGLVIKIGRASCRERV